MKHDSISEDILLPWKKNTTCVCSPKKLTRLRIKIKNNNTSARKVNTFWSYLTCFRSNLIFTMWLWYFQGMVTSLPSKTQSSRMVSHKHPKACIISITCCCSLRTAGLCSSHQHWQVLPLNPFTPHIHTDSLFIPHLTPRTTVTLTPNARMGFWKDPLSSDRENHLIRSLKSRKLCLFWFWLSPPSPSGLIW